MHWGIAVVNEFEFLLVRTSPASSLCIYRLNIEIRFDLSLCHHLGDL